jgi:hypothetical protein
MVVSRFEVLHVIVVVFIVNAKFTLCLLSFVFIFRLEIFILLANYVGPSLCAYLWLFACHGQKNMLRCILINSQGIFLTPVHHLKSDGFVFVDKLLLRL